MRVALQLSLLSPCRGTEICFSCRGAVAAVGVRCGTPPAFSTVARFLLYIKKKESSTARPARLGSAPHANVTRISDLIGLFALSTFLSRRLPPFRIQRASLRIQPLAHKVPIRALVKILRRHRVQPSPIHFARAGGTSSSSSFPLRLLLVLVPTPHRRAANSR